MKIKTNDKYLKRILRLADFVENIPNRRFYFGNWVGHDWAGDPTLKCGTTACAIGWATTMPYFQKLGLYMTPPVCWRPSQPSVLGQGYVGVRKLFGLNSADFSYCFVPDFGLKADATPKQWAAHARRFVKDKMEREL